jgi:hypothetical protein
MVGWWYISSYSSTSLMISRHCRHTCPGLVTGIPQAWHSHDQQAHQHPARRANHPRSGWPGWPTPLKNHGLMEWVSERHLGWWKKSQYIYIWKVIIQSCSKLPNRQPDIAFEVGNKISGIRVYLDLPFFWMHFWMDVFGQLVTPKKI